MLEYLERGASSVRVVLLLLSSLSPTCLFFVFICVARRRLVCADSQSLTGGERRAVAPWASHLGISRSPFRDTSAKCLYF